MLKIGPDSLFSFEILLLSLFFLLFYFIYLLRMCDLKIPQECDLVEYMSWRSWIRASTTMCRWLCWSRQNCYCNAVGSIPRKKECLSSTKTKLATRHYSNGLPIYTVNSSLKQKRQSYSAWKMVAFGNRTKSSQTVHNRLHVGSVGGLYTHRPVVCISLTSSHSVKT